jgi:subtilisin family serine protease
MTRIRAALRLSDDAYRRERQLAYLAGRDVTVLRAAGSVLWVSATDSQLPRFAEQGIVAQRVEGSGTLHLPALAFDPADGVPEPPAGLAAAANHPYRLVLFAAPPAPEWFARVGGAHVRDVPAQGAVFRGPGSLSTVDFVVWSGPYHPAYAIDVSLTVPLPVREDGNLRVGFFDDIDPESARLRVEATGARVLFADGQSLVLVADAAQVPALARIPGVAEVEPFAAARPELTNSRRIVGVDQVVRRQTAVRLDGAGEVAAVMDTGLDSGNLTTMHQDLAGRVRPLGLFVKDTDGHGTHTAGILAGNGTGSPNAPVTGVAPAVILVPQNAKASLIDNLNAALRAGVRVHSNSWATELSADQRVPNRYVQISSAIDQFVCAHPDMLVVFSAGNEEKDVRPRGGDGKLDQVTLSGQKVAKNILCVGASENKRGDAGVPEPYNVAYPGFGHQGLTAIAGGAKGAFATSDDPDDVAPFSNRGRARTAAGQLLWGRPHLVAPGTNIVSLRSSESPLPARNRFDLPPAGLSPNLYRVLSGTSMAAPHVSGAAVLVRQFYRSAFRLTRRPRLLHEAATFPGPPTIASHVDGLVSAWQAQGPARVLLRRTTADLAPLAAKSTATDAGAPHLARYRDTTLVLLQQADALRLRRLRRDLTADPGFTTVTVTPDVTTTRPAALTVAGDRAAVAWAPDSDGRLRVAVYNAGTGTAVGTPLDLGPAGQLSAHTYLAHNGVSFAVVWPDQGANRLWFRRFDAGGQAVGAPVALADQATPVREPHLAWDPARGRFLVVWCDDTTIRFRYFDATGTATAPETTPVRVPAGRRVRRPYVAAHPVRGGVLVWEDDADGTYDIHHTLLDATGLPHTAIPADPHDPLGRRLLRISDSARATEGFAAATAQDGSTAVVWQGSDETAARDRSGVHAVAVTADGTFLAPADPRTPLARSGAHVTHTLAERPGVTPSFVSVGACWAGGPRFLLRPGAARAMELVRTTQDGVAGTARPLSGTADADLCSLLWTGQRLVVLTAPRTTGRPTIRVLDADGGPIQGLPPRMLRLAVGDGAPELGFVPGPDARILVGYRSGARLRLAVLTGALADTTAADHDLVPDLGQGHELVIARHGWFHYVHEENLALAAWTDQDRDGATASIARSRRSLQGTFQRLANAPVTAVPGMSRNAVLAPRPVRERGPEAGQREYLAAFQFRSAANVPWEIRTSRVTRDGQVMPDSRVIFPGAEGVQAGRDALDPQLACTYTDDPRSTTGSWCPAFGLAFLSRPSTGGNRTLCFTLLDETGRRLPDAGTPAPVIELTDVAADVLDFSLAWTGRHFWLTWAELRDGALRHRQTLLSRSGTRMVHDAPTAALLRATLLNGTAIPPTTPPAPLPNVDTGFGWGRLDLRQTLVPAPPVTFRATDDAVGPGGTLEYEVDLPAGTALLRVTLAWDDPPGPAIRAPLSLHVLAPGGQEFLGNVWDRDVSAPVSGTDPLPPPGDNVQQVIRRDPAAGRYRVLVRAGVFGPAPHQQFPAQAIAVVIVGSGAPAPYPKFANTTKPVM